jgi:hypothetical protein
VAEHNGISEAEVIEIHSSADYLVYMMGFLPGNVSLDRLTLRRIFPFRAEGSYRDGRLAQSRARLHAIWPRDTFGPQATYRTRSPSSRNLRSDRCR